MEYCSLISQFSRYCFLVIVVSHNLANLKHAVFRNAIPFPVTRTFESIEAESIMEYCKRSPYDCSTRPHQVSNSRSLKLLEHCSLLIPFREINFLYSFGFRVFLYSTMDGHVGFPSRCRPSPETDLTLPGTVILIEQGEIRLAGRQVGRM